MILTPLQKLPNNEGNLGKIIVATGLECLPNLVTLLTMVGQCDCLPFEYSIFLHFSEKGSISI